MSRTRHARELLEPLVDADRYAFATFDANNDGTIDFDEFLLAIAATSQGNLDDRLGIAFEMYNNTTAVRPCVRLQCVSLLLR